MNEEPISLSEETINKLADALAAKLAPVVTPRVPAYPVWNPPYYPGQYYHVRPGHYHMWNTGGTQA